MSEWKEYKLGEIISLHRGYDLPSSQRKKGTIPIVSSSGISDYHDSYKMLPPGVVTGRYGTIGEVFFLNEPYWPLNTTLYIDDFKGNDPLFIYYFLKSFDFEKFNDKSTIPGINRNHLYGEVVKIPSLDEQKRIASILSSLDDKIDLLNRENATLEGMAETLFRQWFIEEAKEDWEERSLKEVADIAIGRTPPRKEFKWFSTNPNDIRWLSIKDMSGNSVFLFNTSEYLTKEAVETFNIPIIPTNTVVLSFKMTVGRVGITTGEMLSNEAIAHFKFRNTTPISKEYMYLFLKTFKYEALGSTSSIVTAINSKMIKDIKIKIPDSETMGIFDYQAQPIFEKIYNNQKQITILRQTRDGLLPKLLSNENVF